MRVICSECLFKIICESKKEPGECPCKICIVKAICKVSCIEAGEYFNKIWKNYPEEVRERWIG